MREYIELGKQIYDMNNSREVRRMLIFCGRALFHSQGVKQLGEYFSQTPSRQELVKVNPYYYEQVTRSFFYKDSTFDERSKIVQEHLNFLEEKLRPECMLELCDCHGDGYTLWQDEYEDKTWYACLKFETGQRKEGLLAVDMELGTDHLYQIIFWLSKDMAGDDALWIGAMQGPNMEHARDIVKQITKRSFAYRTKNLILYMTQAVARSLGVRTIYAVTNYGYYANNHMRSDRKLKTNFEDFWREAGGEETADKRFFRLPLVEARKSMDEVKTHKRNLYRKRFAFLDEIDEKIAVNMAKILK